MVLIISFLFGLFVSVLFYCKIKGENKIDEKIQASSSWIKSASELYKEAKIKYLKTHKRKITPKAAKIYNEQLLYFKQRNNYGIDFELNCFEKAIINCDMEMATKCCEVIWNTDAKDVVNEYLMSRLFKIHDCYE